jgi:hypothetical protein
VDILLPVVLCLVSLATGIFIGWIEGRRHRS